MFVNWAEIPNVERVGISGVLWIVRERIFRGRSDFGLIFPTLASGYAGAIVMEKIARAG
jgi:hypothetical protein